MYRRITALLCLAALAVLAACSSSGATHAPRPHDAADVAFATEMVPHHSQAVEMADLAATRASDAQVTALAARIRSEQQPEITAMSGWLTAWGESVPSGSMAHLSHGGSAMPGMMSTGDLATLGRSTGAAFDSMWVTMMTAHHRGALTMAATEIADGRDPDAIALAKSIVTTQTKEIAELTTLAARLG